MNQEPIWLDKTLTETVALLSDLIRIPSFSKEEEAVASFFENQLKKDGIEYTRTGNNLIALNRHFNPDKTTILLNSHCDTVKPNPGYTRNPFSPDVEEGKLFGLGSNDAGASLVCLYQVFRKFYSDDLLRYNLVFVMSAEEEISGSGGIEMALDAIGTVEAAIVGEPTQMHAAIAEKGLLVIDCLARGKAGHAAREEGINAIYLALDDINWFRSYRFPEISETLGPVKMNVTCIEAGIQHNVVPAECRYTVDIRTTDRYTHEEILDTIRKHIKSEITPRSLRMKSSFINPSHPLVQSAVKLGRKTYGSPTTSDQALIPWPSLKMGPGDSARSHQADEFIYLSDLREGLTIYYNLLFSVLK